MVSAHDSWLARYRRSEADVWCSNPKCGLHADGATVTYEEEYGQGWYTPEECYVCHSDWLSEPPPEKEDDDDE